MIYYRKTDGTSRKGLIEQLLQLTSLIWDGDLISKEHRDQLVSCGYAYRFGGYSIITAEGVDVIAKLRLIKS